MPGTVTWTPIPSSPHQVAGAATFNGPTGQVATALQNHQNGVPGTRHVATEIDSGILDNTVSAPALSVAATDLNTRVLQFAESLARLAVGSTTTNWATAIANLPVGADNTSLFNSVGGATSAATVNAIAKRDVDAGINFGHVAVTGQNVARIVGSFMATPASPGNATVFAIGVTAVGDIMSVTANKNVNFGGTVTAPTLIGTHSRTDNGLLVSQVPGTSQVLGGASYPGQQFEIAIGTAAAPTTVAAPTMKVSRYENLSTPTINSEVNAVIIGYSQNTAASLAQVTGIQGVAVTNATGRSDAVGLVGVGRSTVDNNTGFGMYIEGQRFTRYGYARAAECRSTNYTLYDDPHVSGQVSRTGALLLSGGGQGQAGRGGSINADAIMITSANTRGNSVDPGWDCGINFQLGAIAAVSIDDSGNAPTSYKIGGAHQGGVDTTAATLTAASGNGQAFVMAAAHGLWSNNNAVTTRIRVIGLDANDRVQLGGALGATFDGQGNNTLPGQLRAGSAGVLLTNPAGNLLGSTIAAGTIPVAAHAPGSVSAGPAAMQVTVAAFPMISTTGAIINAAGGTLTLIAPTTTNFVQTALIYADNTGTPQVAYGAAVASNPAPPSLPASARAFATVLLTQGMTTITQSLITQFRDMNVPLNANAAGGAPGADTYVVVTADPANLPNAVTAATLLGGGNGTLGNPLAALKPITTDATLNDLLNSRYLSPYLPLYLGFSGTQVSLGAGGGTQHTVYINGKLRTITSTITSVSMTGSAAGTYFLYADVSAASVSTFTLAISALNTNSPTVNQANIGAFYWNGTAFQSDLNTSSNSRASVAQVQPKIVNAQNSGNIAITNTGGLLAVPASGTLPFTYATSGSTTYYFTGTLYCNVTGGTAATAATIQPFLNGTAVGTSYGSKTLAASTYDQIIIPTTFALTPNAVNSITLGANASAASGYTINGVYLIGVITGGV